MAPVAWARESFRVYVGNASAVRDFRTQLRGSRAAWIWTLYLLVLVGFAVLFYSSVVQAHDLSISEAQRRLQTYYQSTIALLAFLISTIAPALTASSVISERQRKSLDLVFSAPVSPRYFLVGKLISSYRYVWMLLVLSLPVTASCVVMGGATWTDVLQAYALLSIHALLFTAIALLYSTICQSVVSAFIWSYLTVILYLLIVSGVSGASMGLMYMHRTMEAPFTLGLSPFFASFAAGTYTQLFGYHVPNLLLVALYTLFLTRLLLLGAASSMSPAGSKETIALRVQGLLGYAAASYLSALAAAGSAVSIITMGGSMRSPWPAIAGTFAGLVVYAGLLVPFLTCYSPNAESKFRNDGAFNLRRTFTGTPSGALPYLFALVLASALAAVAGALTSSGTLPPLSFLVLVLWAVAVLYCAWAAGRLISERTRVLRTSRSLHYGALIVLWLLPVPVILSASAQMGRVGEDVTLWDCYALGPIVTQPLKHPDRVAELAIVLATMGFLLYFLGQGRRVPGVTPR